ncbi:uncharacterized protein LOC120142917 [Hibiscus syriacus]|nr:uncharacterized protein LOC120142917 [Hibiscus syriacus]
MNQIGLVGPSQINQSGLVGSSHISQPEPTWTSHVNRPDPTQASQVNLPEPMPTSQVNQVGIASSSEFNRTEPIQRVEIKQKPRPSPPPPAAEHTRTESNGLTGRTDSTRPSQATESQGPTFWTACPYCYILYEYPKMYEDCTLRCQAKNCRRAFHAVVIQPPPVNGNVTHFCCMGFFPLGFSGKDKNKGSKFPSWSPISNMFACPMDDVTGKQKSAPRVYYEDYDSYVEIFDSSGPSEDDYDDDEWQKYERKKKKANNAKGKGSAGRKPKKAPSATVDKGSNQQVSATHSAKLNGVPMAIAGRLTAESSSQSVTNSGRKQMVKGAKSLGKLDLNVEFSNEGEEPVARRSEGNRARTGEEDNIEGNGFFEGLDEFLSSLPILSNVGDEKVKAT